MDWLMVFYLGFIFLYRLGQFYAIIKAHNLYKPDHSGDWYLALVWMPMFLVVIGAPYEYFLQREMPGIIFILLGAAFFLSAIVLRSKSLADLTQEYIAFEDKNAKYQLFTQGIFQYVRHPLYLANILLMIACSLFFGSLVAGLITVMGVGGVIMKINMEEKVLEQQDAGFADYRKKTFKLIPKIF
jgi:protein-S-isoprenylcysteine O-methyltransferase Ste14